MTTRFIGFDPVTLNIVDSFYGSGSAGRSKKMKYMQVDPDVHIRNVKVVKVSELEYALENKVPTEQYLENQKTLENAFIYENLRNRRGSTTAKPFVTFQRIPRIQKTPFGPKPQLPN
jgi:hypothetical protein